MKVYVVGAGMGDEAFLTSYAKKIIQSCDVVLGPNRLVNSLGHLNSNTTVKSIKETLEFVRNNSADKVCILASGDVGFYSVARIIKEKLQDYNIEFVSGISSIQYFTAKFGISYTDCNVMSMHGRDGYVVPNICYNRYTFILTGGKHKACAIIKQLNSVGLSNVIIHVGENLSSKSERIVSGRAHEMLGYEFDHLAVMLIENNDYVNPYKKIYDSEFIRGKTPMTKEAIRTLSIGYLEIEPGDVVVDIGAGTGSVTIEMARKANKSIVYAIECKDDAVDLIVQNIRKFSAYNIELISAMAPDGMEKIKWVDKAFIGGSRGNISGIIDTLVAINDRVKIVVTAITLETMSEAVNCMKSGNFSYEISCVTTAGADKVGKYHMMKGENPIYIIVGEKMHD